MARYSSPSKLAVKLGSIGGVGEIHRGKMTFTAAICPECGGKLWPANLLAAHLERHASTSAQWSEYMRPLRKALGSMRKLF